MYDQILRTPDLVMISVEGDEYTSRPASEIVSVKDIQVTTTLNPDGLHVVLTALATPVRIIRLRWKTYLPTDVRILGDAWERTYGDAGWSGMIPYRAMPWYFLVQNGENVAGYGVKVRAGAMCFWQADPAGITLWLDVRSGGEGVILGGRTLEAAVVISEAYHGISAFEAARKFCGEMCTDPKFPDEPVYGSNNWYYAYGISSEEEILKDTDYLVRLTEGLVNRPFMVIDDCWQVRHNSEYNGGPWNLGNEKFPDMPGLVRKIKEKGVRAGVWFRPLLDSGEDIPDDWRLPTGALDASHPGVLSRVREDITRLCEWGFGLIKHDFSTFDSFGKWGFMMQPLVTDDGWHFYDRSKTSAEILVNFYRVIYEAAAPYGTLILGCNTVDHLAAGLEHMQRTGDDTSGLLWERTMRTGVNTLAFRMPQHRTFFDCDADCYGDVGEIPWEYNRLWGDLLAKSGTSFFFSVKPGLYTKEQNRWLAAILTEASKQEQIAEPLDWQNTIYPQKWRSGDTLLSYDWYQDIGLRVVAGPGIIWEEYQEKKVF